MNQKASFKILPNVLLGVVAIWLLVSAFYVSIEYEDGYLTIVNGRFFMGYAEDYSWKRGLIWSILMAPAAFLSKYNGLRSFDLVIYHLVSGVVHVCYLLFVWKLLVEKFGRGVHAIISYAVSIITYVFVSYAPFISPDIFPGALFLAILINANSYYVNPEKKQLFYIFLLSIISALVKPTYSLFPVLAIAAYLYVCVLIKKKIFTPQLAGLFFVSVVAGIVVWVGYCFSTAFPGSSVGLQDTDFFFRPIEMISRISEHYKTTPLDEIFPIWIYAVNASAYGLTAMILVIPSLIFNLRSTDSLQIMIAVAWIGAVVVMHLTPFKEVRYLAFLAPLTAFLLVPFIERLLKVRYVPAFLVFLIVIDLLKIIPEAQKISDSFYKNSVLSYFEPIDKLSEDSDILYTNKAISFVSPSNSGLFADRYHNIHYLSISTIRDLMGRKKNRMHPIDIKYLSHEQLEDGVGLISTNGLAIRVPPWNQSNPTGISMSGLRDNEGFLQITAVAEGLRFEKIRHDFRVDNARNVLPVLLIKSQQGESQPLILQSDRISSDLAFKLYGELSRTSSFEVKAFRIRSFCDLSFNCVVVGT